MNSRRIPHWLAALAVLSVAATAASATDIDGDQLSAFVEDGMDLWHVPAMSVTVVTSNDVLYQQSFGTTGAEQGRPVDAHTLFAVASTTKAMTAAGILMLVDEGKLTLDDLIIEHIPELHFSDPSLTSQLTIRDLLAHRTGLPSTDYWFFLTGLPLDEQLRRLRTVEAEAPVRTRLIYQNTMYEIAGLVIERISGERWHHFLTERLWHPIGMLETYGTRGEIKPDQSHVTPYFYLDEQLTAAEWDMSADQADAAGSVWSSVHDMGLWAQFLLRDGVTASGDRLISKQGIKQMFTPHQLSSASDFYPTVELTQPNWQSYGLAWFQQDFQGRKIDFHTGSLSGLIAIIGLDRKADRAVVVLGNRDHAEMRHAILWQVMDDSGPAERRDWNRDVFDLYENLRREGEEQWQATLQHRLKHTRPGLPPEAYAGRYRSETVGDVEISRKKGTWTLHSGRIDFAMSHWHLDTFLSEYRPWDMREFTTFNIGAKGNIVSLEFLGHTFERIDRE